MPNGANPNKLPVIVAGPTGVGKTAFAVELATQLDGEIIGADAYQVYRGLEILTGQPTREILQRAPHHLVGFLPATEDFDAARFIDLAREKIADVFLRGKLPIVVGGSGLYLKALTHGLTGAPPPDATLRAELARLSPAQLREQLLALDPATRVDLRNPRRVLRALEVSILTGRPSSVLHRAWEDQTTSGFRGLLLVRDRAELDDRIARNVQNMFERGVVAEVARLQSVGRTASMAIGLREIQSFLRGDINEAKCRAAIALASRRYAKRQLTWFRNQFRFETVDLTGLRDTHEIPPSAMEILGAV